MITKFSASSISNKINYDSMLAGNPSYIPPSFEQISTTILGSNTTSVTFSSIPSTYKHLQVRMVVQDTAGAGLVTNGMRINGDGAANYSTHWVRGTGTTSTVTGSDTGSSYMVYNTSSTGVAGSFTLYIIDLYNYANTSTFKTMRMLMGMGQTSANGTNVGLHVGNWRNTAAVSSLTFLEVGGNAFITGSRFSLYGISG